MQGSFRSPRHYEHLFALCRSTSVRSNLNNVFFWLERYEKPESFDLATTSRDQLGRPTHESDIFRYYSAFVEKWVRDVIFQELGGQKPQSFSVWNQGTVYDISSQIERLVAALKMIRMD